MTQALFFYLFAAVTVLPGIFVLATRDIVRAAFWLLAALSGFAGLYVLLGADFLAVTQVIVYLGGILILILFGVMLTHKDPALVRRSRRLNIVVPGIFGGATLTVAVLVGLLRSHFAVVTLGFAMITPNAGPTTGGTPVTITGSELAKVTAVTIDGQKLTDLKLVPGPGGTQVLQGVTPRVKEPSFARVVLDSETAGSVSVIHGFHYEAVSPSEGSMDGSTKVTIALPVDEMKTATKVWFDDRELEQMQSSANDKVLTITGLTPKVASAGNVTVKVEGTNAEGASATVKLRSAYRYFDPKEKPPAAPATKVKVDPLPDAHFTGTTRDVGNLLVRATDQGRSYALAFELASVLLLAALVGAAYIARRGGGPAPTTTTGRGPGEIA